MGGIRISKLACFYLFVLLHLQALFLSSNKKKIKKKNFTSNWSLYFVINKFLIKKASYCGSSGLVSALSGRHLDRKAQILCSKRSLYTWVALPFWLRKVGFGTVRLFKSTQRPFIRTAEGLATHCGLHIKYVCEIITSMNIWLSVYTSCCMKLKC